MTISSKRSLVSVKILSNRLFIFFQNLALKKILVVSPHFPCVSSGCGKDCIKPLINKSLLDPSKYKNYRPVYNLRFVSKAIEMIVANQPKSYLYANNLDGELQSAYGKKHNTSTAHLKVVGDIRSCIDQDQGVILMLLDISAAFDTVDYDILAG